MIKIERKETEKTEQAIADLQKANDNESTYNIESVNRALREVFCINYIYLFNYLFISS